MAKKLIVTFFILTVVLTAVLAVAQEHGEGEVMAELLNPDYVPFFVAVALSAGIAMGIGSFGTAIGMGNAIRGAVDGVSRNPDTYGRILTTMMIGLAMIESLAIYTLIVALLLLFANPFLKVFGF